MGFFIISRGIVFYSNYKVNEMDEMGCRSIVWNIVQCQLFDSVVLNLTVFLLHV